MIDKDGIERPDKPDENILKIKHDKRNLNFDSTYNFRPRNIFFRLWSMFFRGLAIAVFNPFMVFKYKMKTYGAENLKTLKKQGKKSFVITCNHVHMFDDVSIGSNLFCWRKIYFTTLDRNIRRRFVGFFLRSLGGIPIPSSSISGMKKFNEDISFLLKKGKPVLYNPEASLWPYYREIRPFKRGAFVTAVNNDVPVLPIVVTFKRKKKRNGKYKYKLYFTICPHIEADKSLSVKQATEKLMNQTYETTVKVADDFYKSQDCGFDDEKSLRNDL